MLCVAGGIALFAFGKGEVEAAQKTIDSFMVAGRNNDTTAASSYIAQAAKDQELVTDAQIEALLTERLLFDEYQSVDTPTTFNVKTATGTGTTATMAGKVKYTSGTDGTYDAELIKEGEQWKLTFINVKRGP